MINKRKTNEKEILKQMKLVNSKSKDGVFIFKGPLTINEFAVNIGKNANEIIKFFFKQGKMFNINYTIDKEQLFELCLEFKLDFQEEKEVNVSNFMEEVKIVDHTNELMSRPPIVTIMGHVDHGKTTLIDKIRKSNITASEFGGITQHTSAYQIKYQDNKITFLDTPGHEAFSAMRLRGAKITDIVILVIAADDGVMAQTKEAVKQANAANVSIIVFINKMDKLQKNLEKIKRDLAQINVLSDDWNGDVPFVYGSALNEEGIDKLLEVIILKAEMLKLKANPNRLAIGTVIESTLDKGKGSVTTLIIQNGSLYKKDFIVAGSQYGHIRSIQDTHNNEIIVAIPSDPVIVTGLNYIPNAGDKFFGFKDEKFAKKLANEKTYTDKQQALKSRGTINLVNDMKILNIIIKADVQGTAEAIKHAFTKLKNDEVKINIIKTFAGTITKSDILLAQAAKAIIYSFNIKPTKDVKQFAEQEKIKIKNYLIIYKMIEEVEALIKSMMRPKFEEKIIGKAKIIKVIPASSVGNIAGSVVISGSVELESKIRLIRNEKVIYTGKLDSLQRNNDQIKKVGNGKEFGCHIHKFNDINVNDIIEVYKDVEVKTSEVNSK